MTTMLEAATTAGTSAGRVPAVGVDLARVLRSEWTKMRSVRSTRWTLLTAVALTVGIGALLSAVAAEQYGDFTAHERATFDPISLTLNGSMFSQLAIGVLGVLTFSGEYSTGMIRSSLTVVPRRLPVLWGKLVVFAAVVFAASLASSVISFLLGQQLLSSSNLDVGLGADGAVRAVVGSALYVTVVGLIGVALGAILRSTAAGISALVGVFFVLPPIMALLPAGWTVHFDKFLPSNAGSAVWANNADHTLLGPWTGFGVLGLYAVAVIGVAAWRRARTDA